MNNYTSACLFKIENINVMTTEDDDLGDSSSDSMSSASEESDSSPEESVQAAAPTLKSSSSDRPAGEPSNDKSSLLQQLPTKRGLSKHYQGKSQSFKSLSNVRVLEDLQKPEHPYNKKLKTKLKSVQYPRDNACLSLNPLSGDNQVQVQNQNPPTQNKTTICSSRPQIPKDKQTSSQDTSSSSISETNNNSTKMIEQKPWFRRRHSAQLIDATEATESRARPICWLDFFIEGR